MNNNNSLDFFFNSGSNKVRGQEPNNKPRIQDFIRIRIFFTNSQLKKSVIGAERGGGGARSFIGIISFLTKILLRPLCLGRISRVVLVICFLLDCMLLDPPDEDIPTSLF